MAVVVSSSSGGPDSEGGTDNKVISAKEIPMSNGTECVGLDIGTNFVVAARMRGGKVEYTPIRSAFIELEASPNINPVGQKEGCAPSTQRPTAQGRNRT